MGLIDRITSGFEEKARRRIESTIKEYTPVVEELAGTELKDVVVSSYGSRAKNFREAWSQHENSRKQRKAHGSVEITTVTPGKQEHKIGYGLNIIQLAGLQLPEVVAYNIASRLAYLSLEEIRIKSPNPRSIIHFPGQKEEIEIPTLDMDSPYISSYIAQKAIQRTNQNLPAEEKPLEIKQTEFRRNSIRAVEKAIAESGSKDLATLLRERSSPSSHPSSLSPERF